MSNTGSLPANFHEGSRSEYLAQYLFAAFGAAVSIPHQEDSGVDLYCTLSERRGALLWPLYHYTVQVKSSEKPWTLHTPDSVEWFVHHPMPLLFCVVDKSTSRIRVFSTISRFLVWTSQSPLPDQLTLVPGLSPDGLGHSWCGPDSYSLGEPILDLAVHDLLKEEVFTASKDILKVWLHEESQCLLRSHLKLPVFSRPAAYEPNKVPKSGFVFQWSTQVHRFADARASILELLPWLAESYNSEKDILGTARVVILMRFMSGTLDTWRLAGTDFAFGAINDALGLKEPRYYYEGIDVLAKRLDDAITLPSQNSTA